MGCGKPWRIFNDALWIAGKPEGTSSEALWIVGSHQVFANNAFWIAGRTAAVRCGSWEVLGNPQRCIVDPGKYEGTSNALWIAGSIAVTNDALWVVRCLKGSVALQGGIERITHFFTNLLSHLPTHLGRRFHASCIWVSNMCLASLAQ